MKFIAYCFNVANLLTESLAKLADPLALLLRGWVAVVFLKSGWLKATAFDNTLFLFREEYRVPLLSPEIAAVAGTTGELLFGALVLLGLCGRFAALGLSAVNVLAVVSYAHVLFSEGFEAALGQHLLWGTMLVMLVVHGPGRWSIDGLIGRVAARRFSWQVSR